MAKPEKKTNAMRMLDTAGITYETLYYELDDDGFSGSAVSALIGIPPERCFKTLCARGAKRGVLVFVIPVSGELDLKAAAAAAGDKAVEMVHMNELPALTGYVRGGVSPVGMKKVYPTFFEETAELFDTVSISGGAKGCLLLIDPQKVANYLGAGFAPLTKE
jgi:Cys-tRNA(Pro)/Cys-tRNA(Cys) deacylase